MTFRFLEMQQIKYRKNIFTGKEEKEKLFFRFSGD